MPVGLIISGLSFTVIVQVAVFPLFVVAVIVAEPFDTPVTTPPLTLATEGLLDVQVTVLYVALAGVTVAVKVVVSP